MWKKEKFHLIISGIIAGLDDLPILRGVALRNLIMYKRISEYYG